MNYLFQKEPSWAKALVGFLHGLDNPVHMKLTLGCSQERGFLCEERGLPGSDEECQLILPARETGQAQSVCQEVEHPQGAGPREGASNG